MTTSSFTPPKYFEISREIIDKIQRSELAVGMPVPSETEIIERYQVSNTTARKVLHELEKAGWVTRVKGWCGFLSTILERNNPPLKDGAEARLENRRRARLAWALPSSAGLLTE